MINNPKTIKGKETMLTISITPPAKVQTPPKFLQWSIPKNPHEKQSVHSCEIKTKIAINKPLITP